MAAVPPAAVPPAAVPPVLSAESAAAASAEPSPVRPARRPAFHALRIAAVERLCDDAVAVTFAVPDGLTEAFAFRPGQTLTLRRVVDGVDERRSYSICALAGGPLRIAVREVPGGLFSRWLVRDAGPGRRWRC